MKHILTTVVAIIGGLLLLSMIGKKLLTSSYKISTIEQAQKIVSSQSAFSLYELSMALKTNDPNIWFIDVRSESDYSKEHLPNAINVPIDKLFKNDFSEHIYGRDDLLKVIYADNEVRAFVALSLLIMRGYNNFKALNGGYSIASAYVVSKPTPSYFHYSDEQKRYNYSS